MISSHKSSYLTLVIFCLFAGCKQRNTTLNGQWKVIAGSHFEESREAWLEISNEHFTMIGPVPGLTAQCLEKLTLEIQENEDDNYILMNPEYRSEQFNLNIIEPENKGYEWIFQITNREIEMELTAIKHDFSGNDIYLCD